MPGQRTHAAETQPVRAARAARRGRHLIGRLTGVLATGLTPSARTDNWLYAYGEVAGVLDLAGR